MKKLVILVVVLGFMLSGGVVYQKCASGTSLLPDGNNLTWIWKSTDLNEGTVLTLANNKFNIVALESTIPSETDFTAFITMANNKSIKVEALMGDPAWASRQYTRQMNQMIQKVFTYNTAHPDSRFSAIHMDIEPHSLPNWKGNEARILGDLYLILSDLKKSIQQYNIKNADNLTLSFDVPYWYNEYDIRGKKFFSMIENVVDKVVVMNYHPTAEKFLTSGESVLNGFTKQDKVLLAADFVDTSVGLNNLTLEELSELLSTASERFAQNSKYSGLGIHDYETYAQWLSTK